MTLQKLKYEANKHGYKLVRQNFPVPQGYKRNRWQEFLNFLLILAICLGATVTFYFLILL